MARSLDQILAELNPNYSGSENIINARLNAIPDETQAGIAQADAKLAQANTNILDAARRRGLGFSGIPVGEQAQYAATDYAPAIANLKADGANKELTLQESLQQLARDKRSQAQSIFDNETAQDFQNKQFQEQVREFNQNLAYQKAKDAADRAASQSNVMSYLGGGGGSGGTSAPTKFARISRTSSGGFNFFDAAGKPINAAQYAQLTNVGYRDLLSQMASAGDKNAKIALKYVGNDFKFGSAPSSVRGSLSALGASGTYTPNIQQGTRIVTNNQGIRVPTF